MRRTKQARRRDAAEEVCWSLLLMMGLGGLEIPMSWRPMLAEPMSEWARLAVETSVMREGDDDAP